MANNEADDIVQNIVLTGNEEVAAGFNKIRDAGERAFEAIENAAKKGNIFTGLAVALAGAAASVAIVTVGMFEFVKATSETVDSLSQLAQQSNSTIEEMSALTSAFAKTGVSTSELSQGFRQMSRFIEQSWTEIKKASRDGADNLARDALAIRSAELALSDAQKAQNNVARDNATQRIQNLTGIKGAILGLEAARLSERRLAGEDTSAEEQQLQLAQASLAVEQASLAVRAAKKKAADDAREASDKAEKAAIAAETAGLALTAARNKARDDEANDINNVTKAIQNLVKGDEDALSSVNASAENLAKGIINSAAKGEEALGNLRGDITDLSSSAPGVQDVFKKMSEAFQHIESNALKTAIASKLLSRTVTQDLIEAISQGPEKIEELADRVKKLGLNVTEADEKIAKDFRSAMFGLVNDISLVAAKISSAFGPGFTTILNALDAAIIGNRQKFIDFANSIASSVIPVVEGLIRVLSGAAVSAEDQWIADYVSELALFGRALKDIVVGVAKFATFVVASFTAVADEINDVFGTKITGFDIFFTALILSTRTAALIFKTVLIEAIGLVTGAMSELAIMTGIALGPLYVGALIAAAGFYALYKAVKAVMDFFGIGKTSHAEEMLDGMDKRLKALATSGGWGELMKRWREIGEEQTKAEDAKDKADAENKELQKNRFKSLTEESVKSAETGSAAHEKAAAKTSDAYEKMSKKASKSIGDLTQKDAEFEKLQKATAEAFGTGLGEAVPVRGATAQREAREGKATNPNAKLEKIGDDSLSELKRINNARERELAKTGVTDDGHLIASKSHQEQLQKDLAEKDKNKEKPTKSTLPQFKEIEPGILQREDLVKSGGIAKPDDSKPVPVEIKKVGSEDVTSLDKGVLHPPRLDFGDGRNGIFDAGPFSKNKGDAFDDSADFNRRHGSGRGLGPGQTPQFSDLTDTPLPRERPPGANTPVPVTIQKDERPESEKTRSLTPESSKIPGGFPERDAPIVPSGTQPLDFQRPEFKPTQGPSAPELTSPEVAAIPGAITALGDKLSSIPESITTLGDKLSSIFESIKAFLDRSGTANAGEVPTDQQQGIGIRGEAEELKSTIDTADASIGTLASQAETLASAFASAVDTIKDAASRASSGGGNTVAAAGGGYISGPGGPTGDKIPALLSDGEFVHRAKATSFWGLDFMRSINNLEIPRFALGGLASLASPSLAPPAFANRGFTAPEASNEPQQRSLTLVLDGKRFDGLQGPVDVVGELEKRAAMQVMSSTGRKAGWA